MNDAIYVTGHQNPDTDSICAAIAYAEFKNKTGSIPAIPIRLGEVNRETQFILNYLQVEPPKLVETVKAQVSDLNIDRVISIAPDISLKVAWNIMKEHHRKSLIVADEEERLLGIVTLSNLTAAYMDIWDHLILSKSGTKLDHILDTLSARPLYIHDENAIFPGKILVAAMKPSTCEELIEKGDVVICGDREDIQHTILDQHASLMIITGNQNVLDEIMTKAMKEGTSIISTPYDSFTASRLVTQSVPIRYVMSNENIISFTINDFVDEIKDIMLETRYRSYPVVDKSGKAVGSISRYHLISHNKKKVILLDHNEKSQSVHGLEDAEVLEILDHHRIADIQTGLPIYFRNEPVGSTSTIVAMRFFENGIRPSKKTAGLLCAAIISDTLLFKSPTTTNIDKMILKRLSDIAGLDVEAFAKEMFKAGTSLAGKTVDEVFHQDFKSFTLNGLKVGVAQVSTMDLEGFASMREDMLILMEKKASENHFSLLVLMLTDILKGGSEMLVVGTEREIFNRAFNVKLEGNSIYIPDVLSRKKQVIPPLTSAITAQS